MIFGHLFFDPVFEPAFNHSALKSPMFPYFCAGNPTFAAEFVQCGFWDAKPPGNFIGSHDIVFHNKSPIDDRYPFLGFINICFNGYLWLLRISFVLFG